MRNENDGAKEARRVIKKFQEYLNSPRVVPEQCYRPSSRTYTLVNYVNHITGLFLSKNYHLIPLFLTRAYNEVLIANPEKVSEPYRQLVISYLSHVAHFIANFQCFDESDVLMKSDIPNDLLALELKPLPESLILTNEF